MSELYGCIAFAQLPALDPRDVVLCPVCSKRSDEHGDPAPCLARWRKRELGSTGLEPQVSFTFAHFANEELDLVKRAQLLAQWMQAPCPCGKAFGDHTQAEIIACAPLNRSR